MLNDKAKVAWQLARAIDALEKRREVCQCDVDDLCDECYGLKTTYESALEAYRDTPGEPDEKRDHIASKRYGYNQKLRVGGQTMYLRTSDYKDGRLAEIFIDVNKEGATLRSVFSSFAISISLGLQHGVPLQEYVDAFVGSKFEPNGAVIGHDQIESATSMVDLIFHDLALSYGAELPPSAKSRQIGSEKVVEFATTDM